MASQAAAKWLKDAKTALYNLPSAPSPKYSIPTSFTVHLNLAIQLAHILSPLPSSPPPPQYHLPTPPHLSSITNPQNPLRYAISNPIPTCGIPIYFTISCRIPSKGIFSDSSGPPLPSKISRKTSGTVKKCISGISHPVNGYPQDEGYPTRHEGYPMTIHPSGEWDIP